jgi:hypothetical protein
MTVKAISIAPSNYENLAEMDRSLVNAMSRRTHGVIFEDYASTLSGVTNLRVEQGGGHTVNVLPGKAVIREKSTPIIRGSYLVQADATENKALPATDTNPFIATVILRVYDSQYGSIGSNTQGGYVEVIKGTPAASPVALSDAAIDAIASTPGGWIRLADVRVNTGDTGAVPAGQFTDKRSPGGFGRIACFSNLRPAGGAAGIEIFQMDDKANGLWDGSTWQIFDTVWQTYTPSWTSTNTNPSIGSGQLTGRYKRDGDRMHLKIWVMFAASPTPTSGGTGNWIFSIPPGYTAATQEEDGFVKMYCAGPVGFVGQAVLGVNGNTIAVYAPQSRTDGGMAWIRNADASGAAGTGVPLIAAAYTWTGPNNNLYIDITFETA